MKKLIIINSCIGVLGILVLIWSWYEYEYVPFSSSSYENHLTIGIIIMGIAYLMMWGCIGEKIASDKNISNGFVFGFFLRALGLIILAFRKDQTLEKLEMLDKIKEKGIISEEEYNIKSLKIIKNIH